MDILRVFMEVPPEIAEGLKSGELVRDAAGVIRKADNYAIFKHLKEVNPADMQGELFNYINQKGNGEIVGVLRNINQNAITSLQTNMLGSMAGLAGITIICTILLYKKLEKIDTKLDIILQKENEILSKINDLYNFNIISLTENLFQARQFYMNKDYENTCNSCNKSAGSILNYILSNKTEYHFRSKNSLNYALQGLAATIYLHCQAQNYKDPQQVPILLTTYRKNIESILDKFKKEASEFRNRLKNTIPTTEDMQAVKTMRNSAQLKTNLETAISFCTVEQLSIEAVQNCAQKEIEMLPENKEIFILAK